MQNKLSNTLTLFGFAALMLVPMAFCCLPGEQHRWQAAKALNQYDRGDQQAALAELRSVAESLPEDQFIQSTLVRWLCENHDADKGLAICSAMLEKDSGSKAWLQRRLVCEGQAGRFDQALETYRELRDQSPQHVKRSRAELNGTAYHRALANQNLAIAAVEIGQCIDRELGEAGPLFHLPLPDKTLIAAALLARHDDSQATVIPLLNRQIDLVQRQANAAENRLVGDLLGFTNVVFPLPARVEDSLEDVRLDSAGKRRTLAFLSATRALLCEDLNDEPACDVDRSLLMDLGFEAQEIVDQLPDAFDCLNIAGGYGMQFLDTRGFINTLLPWSSEDLPQLLGGSQATEAQTGKPSHTASYQAALRDLDIAVLAAQIALARRKDAPETTPQRQLEIAKTVATLLYHRSLAHQRAGETEALNADRQAIVDLGFQSGPHLF